MQNTRLTTLIQGITGRLTQWLNNPWRRVSVILLGLFLGFFLGSVVSTTTGQGAVWDISSAAASVVVVELISRYAYSYNRDRGPWWQFLPSKDLGLDTLNACKLGYVYGLFLDAFKLGSWDGEPKLGRSMGLIDDRLSAKLTARLNPTSTVLKSATMSTSLW